MPLRRRPEPGEGLIAVASAMAMLFAWWATRWGPGTSPDSFGYLSAAVSLAESGRIDSVTGEPLTQFPPGYPVVLRIVMVSGVSPITAARLVGIVTAGLLVLVAAVLARRTLASPVGRAAVIVAAAVAPGIAQIHRMAWTEPLFSVVVVLVAIALVDLEASGTPPTRTRLVGLAALTSLAFLLRYAGLGLVPGVVLALVLLGRGRRPWVRDVAVYVGAACVVPALWFGRNLVVSGDIGGPPLPARDSLLRDLRTLVETVGDGLIPLVDAGSWLSLLVGLAAIAALVALTVQAARADTRRDVLAIAALVVCLVAHLLLSARLSWVAIGSRMLAPLVVPVVALAAIGLERRRATAAESVGRRQGSVLFGALAIAAAVLIGWTVEAVDASATAHREGVGGQSTFWRRPALAADLALIPAGGVVVSNEPGPVWQLTGRPVVGAIGTTGAIRIDECRDPVHMVWMLNARWEGTEPPRDGDVVVERPRWSIRTLPAGTCGP